MTITIEDVEQTTPVSGQLARLSALYHTHRQLGARFVEHAGWQLPDVYTTLDDEAAAVRERVGVADVSAVGKLLVRGEAQELLAGVFGVAPEAPGDVLPALRAANGVDPSAAPIRIAGLTSDEYLALTPPGAEREAKQRLVSEALHVTVVDQTSGLAGLVVAGPDGRGLLSKLCALPFAPSDFPNHHVAQSSLARVRTIIVRNDLGEVPAFELYFDRSYGEYMWKSIIDAGGEFGVAPFGGGARELLGGACKTWGARPRRSP